MSKKFVEILTEKKLFKIEDSKLLLSPKINEIDHPLLYAVWQELEKTYPGETRREIIANHSGEKKVLLYTDSGQIPELNFFMWKLHKLYDSKEPGIQLAIDAVNQLPNNKIKSLFKAYIDRFVQYSARYYIKDIEDSAYSIFFKSVKAFNESFLKRAIPILRQKKIPDFAFGTTNYDYLVNEITNLANNITSYLEAKEFNEEAVIYTIIGTGFISLDISELHANNLNSALAPFSEIVRSKIKSNKSRLNRVNAKRLENSEPCRTKYLELWKTMKLNAPDISTVKVNNEFRKWCWKNGIARENQPIAVTLQRWRLNAELK